jgi:hypothetical protein
LARFRGIWAAEIGVSAIQKISARSDRNRRDEIPFSASPGNLARRIFLRRVCGQFGTSKFLATRLRAFGHDHRTIWHAEIFCNVPTGILARCRKIWHDPKTIWHAEIFCNAPTGILARCRKIWRAKFFGDALCAILAGLAEAEHNREPYSCRKATMGLICVARRAGR